MTETPENYTVVLDEEGFKGTKEKKKHFSLCISINLDNITVVIGMIIDWYWIQIALEQCMILIIHSYFLIDHLDFFQSILSH